MIQLTHPIPIGSPQEFTLRGTAKAPFRPRHLVFNAPSANFAFYKSIALQDLAYPNGKFEITFGQGDFYELSRGGLPIDAPAVNMSTTLEVVGFYAGFSPCYPPGSGRPLWPTGFLYSFVGVLQ